MVLLKIEALSTAELQYIASQEKMDDWESLSREELIDALCEIYDEVPGNTVENNNKKGLHKFTNSLSDVQFTKMMNLPGVEALPEEYLETSIHCLLKDPFWAYVFWSISPNTRSECEDRDPNYRVFIRTIALDKNQKSFEHYDIDVSPEDISWTVALPWMGISYQVELVVEYPKTKVVEVLAISEIINNPPSLDPKVLDSLKGSQQASLILSSLVSKNGEMMNNKLVSDMFATLNDSDDTKDEDEK